MAVEIVELSPELVPVLAHVGKKFYADTQSGELNLKDIVSHWRSLICSGLGVCFVMFDNGRIPVGFLCGFKTYSPESGKWIAVENHWYVPPQWRGHGVFLLKRFESWAERQNCSIVQTGEIFGIAPKNLGALYKKMGYNEYQKVWRKQI